MCSSDAGKCRRWSRVTYGGGVVSVPARRPGRRPGPSSSREEILAAARLLFAERGYDKASIRAIAREARVDPALVHHFFGTKEKLFVAAMEFPVDPAVIVPAVVGGPRSEIGERLVRTFLKEWGNPHNRPYILAIVRSATTTDQGAKMLREFVTATILARVTEVLGVPRLNLTAAAAQMIGVVLLRYVLEVEPIASAPEEELVELIAPTIQRYLDG